MKTEGGQLLEAAAAEELFEEGSFVVATFGVMKDKFHNKLGKVEKIVGKKAKVLLLEGPAKGSTKEYPLTHLKLKRGENVGQTTVVPAAGYKRAAHGIEGASFGKAAKIAAQLGIAHDILRPETRPSASSGAQSE